MPEKLKHHKAKNYHNGSGNKDHYYDQNNMMPYMQPPMIQISSLADIMALGGFNPNKYLSPAPVAFTPNGQFGYQQAIPPHMMGVYQQPQYQGMPAPVQNFTPGQGPQVSNFNNVAGQTSQTKNGKSSPSKNGQRYEKKDKQSNYPQGKKKSGSAEQKKYVSKEKKTPSKEDNAKKAEWIQLN